MRGVSSKGCRFEFKAGGVGFDREGAFRSQDGLEVPAGHVLERDQHRLRCRERPDSKFRIQRIGVSSLGVVLSFEFENFEH